MCVPGALLLRCDVLRAEWLRCNVLRVCLDCLGALHPCTGLCSRVYTTFWGKTPRAPRLLRSQFFVALLAAGGVRRDPTSRLSQSARPKPSRTKSGLIVRMNPLSCASLCRPHVDGSAGQSECVAAAGDCATDINDCVGPTPSPTSGASGGFVSNSRGVAAYLLSPPAAIGLLAAAICAAVYL